MKLTPIQENVLLALAAGQPVELAGGQGAVNYALCDLAGLGLFNRSEGTLSEPGVVKAAAVKADRAAAAERAKEAAKPKPAPPKPKERTDAGVQGREGAKVGTDDRRPSNQKGSGKSRRKPNGSR